LLLGQYNSSNDADTNDVIITQQGGKTGRGSNKNLQECTTVALELSRFISEKFPSLEVRLASRGLNEDFQMMVDADVFIGGTSRMSLAAVAVRNRQPSFLPMQTGVGCGLTTSGLTWVPGSLLPLGMKLAPQQQSSQTDPREHGRDLRDFIESDRARQGKHSLEAILSELKNDTDSDSVVCESIGLRSY
jgi:hypothetical protein